MIVYIDTLAVLFRAYYAIPDLTGPDGTPTGALYGLTNTLFRIIRTLEPDHIVACFDRPEATLRQQADETYKANRDEAEEELITQIGLARELLESFGVHVVEKEGYEADDLLGTLATKDAARDEDVVIVTCDGDMLQLTTNEKIRVYFLKRGTADFAMLDDAEAAKKNGYPTERIIDFKGLAGDSSDNIKGVAGIGKTYATKLINTYGALESIYDALDAGKVEKDFTPRVAKLLGEGRESAFASRDLATIHVDVPVRLPHEGASLWRDSINVGEAREMLSRYGFDSLSKTLDIISSAASEVEEVEKENISEVDARKLSIMLWVLDAAQTDPSIEDVFAYTKTTTVKEAYAELERALEERGLANLWREIEEPLIPVIEDMKRVGVKLDKAAAAKLSKVYTGKITALEQEIHALAGTEFNIHSPAQLGEVLYDKLGLVPKSSKKTSKGARTTKESVLVTLDHPIVPLILEYRHTSKLLSTYIDALPRYMDDADRIHPTLLQSGTSTGRFAARDPNIQNIPVGGDEGRAIRDMFIAEKGYDLIAVDYSQIQLRLAAILSGDETLLETFRQGKDVHISVASRMFNIAEADVTKAQRSSAKAINFGILYGMGAASLQQHVGSTREVAEKFIQTYKGALPKLFAYLDSIKREAVETGFVRTPLGRERPVEGIHSKLGFVRAQAERVAVSSVIQGAEADVIKIAMVRLHKLFEEEGVANDARMVLQIHDEIVFEVRSGLVDTLVPKIVDIMQSVYPPKNEPIPLTVDVHRGTAWGSLE